MPNDSPSPLAQARELLTVAQARSGLNHAIGAYVAVRDLPPTDYRRRHADSALDRALDALVAAAKAAGRAEERDRCEPLRIFAKKYLDAARGGYDLDFGDVQDAGEKLGLLRVELVREPCGEGCACLEYASYEGFPMRCYRDTDLLSSPTTEEAQGCN